MEPRQAEPTGGHSNRSISPQLLAEGYLGRVVLGEHLTMVVFEVEPGAVLPQHRHVNEQFGMVIEGSVRFRVGEETQTLEPGGIWRIPANTAHTFTGGETGAVVLDVFSPARDDWTAREKLEPVHLVAGNVEPVGVSSPSARSPITTARTAGRWTATARRTTPIAPRSRGSASFVAKAPGTAWIPSPPTEPFAIPATVEQSSQGLRRVERCPLRSIAQALCERGGFCAARRDVPHVAVVGGGALRVQSPALASGVAAAHELRRLRTPFVARPL
jgi:quercetin dioxygenase-like cupin family protein